MALVAPDDWTVWLFYRHLVKALTRAGARITLFSAGGPYVPRLHELGIEHVPVPYGRFVSPYRDIQLFRSLRTAFRSRPFDLVQNFTIKANLYGALAATACAVRTIINTVEGAGLLYSGHPTPRIRVIRAIAEAGLRQVRSRVFRYWFVNPHDREVFVRRRLATPGQSVVAIATGVDTHRFDARAVSPAAIAAVREELAVPGGIPIVSMVAGRLLRSKGIGDFLEMARGLRRVGIAAQAVLVGPEEPSNPDAFSPAALNAAVREGIVRWVGFREDVWTVYAASDVVVVPSNYAEGTPKGVMEGMAMGRPVVGSDLPSIRQLVTHGRDGVVVHPQRPDQLAGAVAELLGSPARREAMGREARRTAETRFDAARVAQLALASIYAAVPGWPPTRRSAA